MRRIYLQVYGGMLAALVVLTLLFAGVAMWRPETRHERELMSGVASLMAELLPADADRAHHARRMNTLREALLADVALYDADGVLLASAGTAPPFDRVGLAEGRMRRGAYVITLQLPDGRWLIADHHGASEFHWLTLGLLVLFAGGTAVAAYPLARRIAGRLERLRDGAETFGHGDLSRRVPVEGNDEVADVARSFNRAAERIERLVTSERALLASVSHELRTPLARMRVAAELLDGAAREETRRQIVRDIEELDGMIEELLLVGRLRTSEAIERSEEIDLLALLAEEGARVGAAVEGEPLHIRGNQRLLRHLLRNLFENARRYGGGSAIHGSLRSVGGMLHLTVADEGNPVPEAERERIFEPFYRAAAARGVAGGTGLGLHLARVIAGLHGGDVHYRPSSPGNCFEVVLPRDAD